MSLFPEILSKRGVSLVNLGLNEVGLRRDDALLAVASLRAAGVPVLGGDVYWMRKRGIEPAYSSWHADRHEGESDEAYLARSISISGEFITGHAIDTLGGEPVFVLVTAEK